MSPDIMSTGNQEGGPTSPSPVPPRKKLSRRKLFALAGGGVLVLVTAGGVWRAADQGVFSTGEGPAYEAWDDWRTASKGPLDLVRAAILAANPHNTQPWLFQVTPSQINLFAGRRHTIGAIDPFLFEAKGLNQLLIEQLIAAQQSNELPADLDLQTSSTTLRAVFFVTPVMVRSGMDENAQMAYHRQLDQLLPGECHTAPTKSLSIGPENSVGSSVFVHL